MNFLNLVKKARTIRRYTQEKIPFEILKYLLEVASFSPSAKNLQLTRSILIHSDEYCRKVDECITLSGSNFERRKDEPRMHPTAYIILCSTPNVPFFQGMDIGIIAQNIQLAACEKNIGTCMIGVFNKSKLNKIIGSLLEETNLEAYLVLAFGYPDEEVHIMSNKNENKSGSEKTYWRDEKNHYVIKNSQDENTLAIL